MFKIINRRREWQIPFPFFTDAPVYKKYDSYFNRPGSVCVRRIWATLAALEASNASRASEKLSVNGGAFHFEL